MTVLRFGTENDRTNPNKTNPTEAPMNKCAGFVAGEERVDATSLPTVLLPAVV